MAQQSKGPRRGFNLRMPDAKRDYIKTRAKAAGMTVTDYLLALVERDQRAETGQPIARTAAQHKAEQLPGLEAA